MGKLKEYVLSTCDYTQVEDLGGIVSSIQYFGTEYSNDYIAEIFVFDKNKHYKLNSTQFYTLFYKPVLGSLVTVRFSSFLDGVEEQQPWVTFEGLPDQ